MKTKKSFISLMLVVAMVFSLNIAPTVSKAEESHIDPFYVSVKVQTPYEVYLDEEDSLVELTENDLKDDFGIGLATDGSDAITEGNGKYPFTAIRAIAKAFRNHIKHAKGIEDDKAANELMKNYINYDNGFINGLSNDGKNWNTGVFEGTASSSIPESEPGKSYTDGFNDGYWNFFVDNAYSNTGVGQTPVSEQPVVTELKLDWLSTVGTYGSPDYATAGVGVITNKSIGIDDYAGCELASKKTTFTVKKALIVPDTASANPYDSKVGDFSAVSGAAISVYDNDKDDVEVYSTTTDDKGKFSLKKNFGPGHYIIVASQPVKNAAGKTLSMMNYTTYDLTLVKTPKTPASVKAKKNKKKKTVTVSWKKDKKGANYSDFYEVYQSTKKNGKYRLATKKTISKNKVTFKLAKSIKYVKVIHYVHYFYGQEGSGYVKDLYGKFSKPIKIK